jgi:hypothetical protein
LFSVLLLEELEKNERSGLWIPTASLAAEHNSFKIIIKALSPWETLARKY